MSLKFRSTRPTVHTRGKVVRARPLPPTEARIFLAVVVLLFVFVKPLRDTALLFGAIPKLVVQAEMEGSEASVICRVLSDGPNTVNTKSWRLAIDWLKRDTFRTLSCSQVPDSLTHMRDFESQKQIIELALKKQKSSETWQPVWGEFLDAAYEARRLSDSQVSDYFYEGLLPQRLNVFRHSPSSDLLFIEQTFAPGRLGPKAAAATLNCRHELKTGLPYDQKVELVGNYSLGYTYGAIVRKAAPPPGRSENDTHVRFECFPDDNEMGAHHFYSVKIPISLLAQGQAGSELSEIGSAVLRLIKSLTFRPAL